MRKKYLGNLFIVAAPSGGGKTSLVRELASSLPKIKVSISHTTRDARPGEQEGVDYYFIDNNTFQSMIAEDKFIEYARVFDNYYGTSIAQIEDNLCAGFDVILDIDWQGAQQVRRLFPNAVSVFIIPPSVEKLKQRLQGRNQDDASVINQRMNCARDEISHYVEFDYLIVNDDFEQAAFELQAIVMTYRLQIDTQIKKQANLLSFLLASE